MGCVPDSSAAMINVGRYDFRRKRGRAMCVEPLKGIVVGVHFGSVGQKECWEACFDLLRTLQGGFMANLKRRRFMACPSMWMSPT